MRYIISFAEFTPQEDSDSKWDVRPLTLELMSNEACKWDGAYQLSDWTEEGMHIEADPEIVRLASKHFSRDSCLFVSGDRDIWPIVLLEQERRMKEITDEPLSEEGLIRTSEFELLSTALPSLYFFHCMSASAQLVEFTAQVKKGERKPGYAYSNIYFVNLALMNLHMRRWTAEKISLFCTLMGNDYFWGDRDKQTLLPRVGAPNVSHVIKERGHLMLRTKASFIDAIQEMNARAGKAMAPSLNFEHYRQICLNVLKYWRHDPSHGFHPRETMVWKR
jgi:hypothetical protein